MSRRTTDRQSDPHGGEDPPADEDPPAGAPAAGSGALARARTLAEGIRGRLESAPGLTVEVDGDRTEFVADGRTVARLLPTTGFLRVDVDPRAGVGNPEALRRLGSPHPDPRLSASGWRRTEVRTRRDAADVVHALRVPREKATGEPRAYRPRYRPAPGGIVVAQVRVRVVYDEPLPEDGARILVDKIRPRGLTREDAQLTDWLPGAAPSDRVRQAFGHVPARLRVFRRAYLAELRGSARAEAVSRLRGFLRRGPLTLLTATRQVELSHAAVLAEAVGHGRTPRA